MSVAAPWLEHIWLCESFINVDPREALPDDLRLDLGLAGLRLEPLAPDRCAVTTGFACSLSREGGEDVLAYISAKFRLLYRGAPPPADLDAQRSLAVSQGLSDAWPVWRTWTLSAFPLMGLSPPPFSPALPTGLRRAAPAEFELSSQQRLAAPA